MTGQLDEAAKQILGFLLADFSDQGLTTKDLRNGYKGPNINDLHATICSRTDLTTTDFEVAFDDLEKLKLIKTGPMATIENRPNGRVVFLGMLYSKREYVYLTEAGYKESKKTQKSLQHGQGIINNLTITGGYFNNTQLGQGEIVSQSQSVTDTTDSEVIAKLISILEEQGQVVSSEQRSDIAAVVSAANEGDGKQARSLLEKVFGPTWESVQPVVWSIVGELVKKSLGL
ncbi:hypothetical protein ACEOUY_003213 [Escherichia coli]|uniref:hypothetical protein n=1 Tax=Escherichia TaxID=561 RepID=UPI000B7E619A|nr:hypothetical protein [Escherichia coli]EEV1147277.1 hypothetical protein [Escherichia coli]EEV7002505.1 hypothetical protein [Escherichia coli]EFB3287259.1 hypothetical protein [Escherichia coli]EFD0930019.1 hypothetical protein [Escherichia coli]EFH7482446.1 hypothetical protein [Escherichia coli]